MFAFHIVALLYFVQGKKVAVKMMNRILDISNEVYVLKYMLRWNLQSIVKFVWSGVCESRSAIALEYLDGFSLKDVSEKAGGCSAQKIANLMKPVRLVLYL